MRSRRTLRARACSAQGIALWPLARPRARLEPSAAARAPRRAPAILDNHVTIGANQDVELGLETCTPPWTSSGSTALVSPPEV
jgi:hypothetical protein